MARVRSSVDSATLAASITSAAMIAQQVGGKAVRDAFFLTVFRVTSLPWMMAAGAALSLAAVLAVSRVLARYSPRKVIPSVFAANAVALALIGLLAYRSPRAASIGLYLDTAVLGPVVISAFWSLVNERFNPHTARAAIARISGGGTLGGVLGGLGTWRLSSAVALPTAVLFLAAANVACVIGCLAIRDPGPAGAAAGPSSAPALPDLSPVAAFRQVPFLFYLAALVALGSACSSLLDYVFSAQATAAYGSGPELLAFFSLFGLGVSVLSLLLQLTLGRLAMEKLGLAVNIAVLPGLVILGSSFGLAVPGLVSSTALRGAEMVQRNTLFRSAYELLYTPLPEANKRATKTVIDVGFDRLGTMLGSGTAMVVLALSHHAQLRLLWLVVGISVATLPLAQRLHRGYVRLLEQGLREGAKKLSLIEPAQGRLSLEVEDRTRDRLIEELEARRHPAEGVGSAGEVLVRAPELLDGATRLLRGNPADARSVLQSWTEANRPLTDLAIAQLAHPTLHVEARAALQKVAPLVVGHLVDALVDPRMEFSVRRRVPAVLSVCRTQRAVDGLLLGVTDTRFEVRYASARALLRVMDRNPDVSLRREVVIEAVKMEIARVAPTKIEVAEEPDVDPWTFSDTLEADRVNRRLEHIFTILALLLDREPLRLAFRALHHEDGRHRGTALEYLQTVMPDELRDTLWPLLSESGPLPAPRPAAKVLEELARQARDAVDLVRARKSDA